MDYDDRYYDNTVGEYLKYYDNTLEGHLKEELQELQNAHRKNLGAFFSINSDNRGDNKSSTFNNYLEGSGADFGSRFFQGYVDSNHNVSVLDDYGPKLFKKTTRKKRLIEEFKCEYNDILDLMADDWWTSSEFKNVRSQFENVLLEQNKTSSKFREKLQHLKSACMLYVKHHLGKKEDIDNYLTSIVHENSENKQIFWGNKRKYKLGLMKRIVNTVNDLLDENNLEKGKENNSSRTYETRNQLEESNSEYDVKALKKYKKSIGSKSQNKNVKEKEVVLEKKEEKEEEKEDPRKLFKEAVEKMIQNQSNRNTEDKKSASTGFQEFFASFASFERDRLMGMAKKKLYSMIEALEAFKKLTLGEGVYEEEKEKAKEFVDGIFLRDYLPELEKIKEPDLEELGLEGKVSPEKAYGKDLLKNGIKPKIETFWNEIFGKDKLNSFKECVDKLFDKNLSEEQFGNFYECVGPWYSVNNEGKFPLAIFPKKFCKDAEKKLEEKYSKELEKKYGGFDIKWMLNENGIENNDIDILDRRYLAVVEFFQKFKEIMHKLIYFVLKLNVADVDKNYTYLYTLLKQPTIKCDLEIANLEKNYKNVLEVEADDWWTSDEFKYVRIWLERVISYKDKSNDEFGVILNNLVRACNNYLSFRQKEDDENYYLDENKKFGGNKRLYKIKNVTEISETAQSLLSLFGDNRKGESDDFTSSREVMKERGNRRSFDCEQYYNEDMLDFKKEGSKLFSYNTAKFALGLAHADCYYEDKVIEDFFKQTCKVNNIKRVSHQKEIDEEFQRKGNMLQLDITDFKSLGFTVAMKFPENQDDEFVKDVVVFVALRGTGTDTVENIENFLMGDPTHINEHEKPDKKPEDTAEEDLFPPVVINPRKINPRKKGDDNQKTEKSVLKEHYLFANMADRLVKMVENYVNNKIDEKYPKPMIIDEKYDDKYDDKYAKIRKHILITGFSKGAGIANLLGKRFEDKMKKREGWFPATYTFAAPGTVEKSEKNRKYETIFNFSSNDDSITRALGEDFGYDLYGKKYDYKYKYDADGDDMIGADTLYEYGKELLGIGKWEDFAGDKAEECWFPIASGNVEPRPLTIRKKTIKNICDGTNDGQELIWQFYLNFNDSLGESFKYGEDYEMRTGSRKPAAGAIKRYLGEYLAGYIKKKYQGKDIEDFEIEKKYGVYCLNIGKVDLGFKAAVISMVIYSNNINLPGYKYKFFGSDNVNKLFNNPFINAMGISSHALGLDKLALFFDAVCSQEIQVRRILATFLPKLRIFFDPKHIQAVDGHHLDRYNKILFNLEKIHRGKSPFAK